ncbi:type II toxin-antitoxin system Xre/ParS family antitoxin [Chamaesiphon minutus]|uniref:Putative toxin-antitoxin system antitoxin component, TIGR02293 family n=1 Tax=Chamaesiphon minutus (strain ATCC 27169 / PCC 6605) TaxID=1173020 RepID=K9UGL9_CHAP6|nr:antitoxin Xre/MbcA/ParS toxin-binding domain-containing protein [Chamaesiphon minutus]AFY93344.1 putative toxin-antitoxin system antitoxin component, TIGR02293 family [Chamaesiphon minutus PCC 6605]
MTSSTQLLDILGISGSQGSSLATTKLSDASTRSESDLIRQGLSIESFRQVANYYQLSDAQLSKVLGTSLRTIVRLQKERKPLNATWSDRLYRLARVAAQAQEVFESPQTATSWLRRPNRGLNGSSPIDLLDTDAGTQQVTELLDRIEYGVYS